MPQTPIIATGPVTDKSDQPVLDKLKRAEWRLTGYQSSVHGDGNVLEAYFGKDTNAVTAFLDKMAEKKITLGTHGAADFKGKDGFIAISENELERLGIKDISLGEQKPYRG
jgi:hypothetical protein